MPLQAPPLADHGDDVPGGEAGEPVDTWLQGQSVGRPRGKTLCKKSMHVVSTMTVTRWNLVS